MSRDQGASPSGDRAVVNGAASVSALRASVPSAVEGEVVCSFNPETASPAVPAGVKVERILRFLGEQEEREAVVDWLRAQGDRRPHGSDWRAYYEAADAIELGLHRDSDGNPEGGNEVPSRSDDSAGRESGIAKPSSGDA
jgi:hypothetical protein